MRAQRTIQRSFISDLKSRGRLVCLCISLDLLTPHRHLCSCLGAPLLTLLYLLRITRIRPPRFDPESGMPNPRATRQAIRSRLRSSESGSRKFEHPASGDAPARWLLTTSAVARSSRPRPSTRACPRRLACGPYPKIQALSVPPDPEAPNSRVRAC